MADTTVFDSDDSSRLLCGESNDMRFDDLDAGGSDAADPNGIPHVPDPITIRVPEITEEIFALMLVREKEYLPKEDYLWRLRSGELEINFRREASDWIWKAHTHYSFGALSFCLSMNYLDRFLSLYDLHSKWRRLMCHQPYNYRWKSPSLYLKPRQSKEWSS